ncbi:sugar-transfer associated ATP-grasp domain-containing protein [Streptomyces sp. NPDC001373]|uniref:sugar-transfer associated ATP-grasp domain-containing protein n=1 Tax=Streptomyces sp. NPDC001373 TaxID=3364565 RepID=UPI0036C0B64D
MRRTANRGFNHRQAVTEEWFRTRVLPRVSGARFLPYQVRQLRSEHVPAMLRDEDRKSTARIAVDLMRVTTRWRCLPFHYFRYGGYQREVSAERACSYLPESALFHRLLPRVNRDTIELDDKTSCKKILASAGIPQPALIASGDHRAGVTSDGEAVSLPDVLDRLSGFGRVVVKPSRYSSGGSGVVIVRPGEDGFDLPAYAQQWGTWLVEQHVPQHPDLDVLNPYVLNTFRVITLLREGAAEVLYVMLKLGGTESTTDNSASGGMQIRVHPDGRLDRQGYDRYLNAHTRHGGSSVPFADHRISRMTEVRELAERCARLFPQVPFIGWDIALTPGGPVVIEGNSSPSLAHIQRTHGGVALELVPALRSVMDRPII